ncbi:MAG: mechanosensitive ion channel family protein, partial [Gammaproteobacteria bacterium]|nr:mechanosensitive ion channel family protein [Gammaproteobacteria bacterium]
QYDIGVGYGDSLEHAKEVFKSAVSAVQGVEQDPAPETLTWDLAASWVTVRVRWWTDTNRASIVAVRSDVIDAIKLSLDEARIDMPYETQVHLFHDQTEETDGDRENQREGWPAPDGDTPKPRWRAESGGDSPSTNGQ